MGKVDRRQREIQIARMLEEGHSVAAIMEATGASRRTVFRRKSARMESLVGESAAGLEALGDASTGPDSGSLIDRAFGAGMTRVEIAEYLGCPPNQVQAGVSARELALEGAVQAMVRLRTEKPVHWRLDREKRRRLEMQDMKERPIPYEIMTRFIEQVIHHQTRIMIDSDCQQWPSWAG